MQASMLIILPSGGADTEHCIHQSGRRRNSLRSATIFSFPQNGQRSGFHFFFLAIGCFLRSFFGVFAAGLPRGYPALPTSRPSPARQGDKVLP